MKDHNHMVISFFRQKIAKLSQQTSSEVWEYRWGLECGLERSGPAFVSVHVFTTQEQRDVEHAKS